MNDDIEHINAEIDRLALKTTDPGPMQLFVEREQLRKRMQMWKMATSPPPFLSASSPLSFSSPTMTMAFRRLAVSVLSPPSWSRSSGAEISTPGWKTGWHAPGKSSARSTNRHTGPAE